MYFKFHFDRRKFYKYRKISKYLSKVSRFFLTSSMVREIISIQLGNCGNEIGTKFWETISNEHGIDPSGFFKGNSSLLSQRLNVYYNEGQGGKYVPRSIFVDLDPASIDNVRGSQYGSLFRPDNFIQGEKSANNNFSVGYYGIGKEILQSVLDIIRKEAESCDCLQAFQFTHSLGGGTGSGFGSLLLQELKDVFPDQIISSYSVIPSPKISDIVVNPYNFILSACYHIDNSGQNFIFDNEALFNICNHTLRLTNPTYGDINHIISMFMSGTTCSLRFPGQLNSDLRKMSVNLVPYPRMHFFIPGLAPLLSLGSKTSPKMSVPELTAQLFDNKNMMASCDVRTGKFMTCSVSYRGKMSTKEVDEQIINIRQQNSPYFCDWIPQNLTTSICNVPHRGTNMSATFVGNTTAIKSIISRHLDLANQMFRRRAFFLHYLNEGMESDDFTQQFDIFRNLQVEYEMYEASGSDFNWGDEKEEDNEQSCHEDENSSVMNSIRAQNDSPQTPEIVKGNDEENSSENKEDNNEENSSENKEDNNEENSSEVKEDNNEENSSEMQNESSQAAADEDEKLEEARGKEEEENSSEAKEGSSNEENSSEI